MNVKHSASGAVLAVRGVYSSQHFTHIFGLAFQGPCALLDLLMVNVGLFLYGSMLGNSIVYKTKVWMQKQDSGRSQGASLHTSGLMAEQETWGRLCRTSETSSQASSRPGMQIQGEKVSQLHLQLTFYANARKTSEEVRQTTKLISAFSRGCQGGLQLDACFQVSAPPAYSPRLI